MIEIQGAYDGTAWPQNNLLQEKVMVDNRQELEKLRNQLMDEHDIKYLVFIYRNTKLIHLVMCRYVGLLTTKDNE